MDLCLDHPTVLKCFCHLVTVHISLIVDRKMKKPVDIPPGNWIAVREEPDQSMMEEATCTAASSSSPFPTLRESRRGPLPTFGNPPPPGPLVSLPVATPTLPQEVNSRNIEKDVTGIASPPLPKTQVFEKNEATRLAVNEVISFMDEEKEDTNYFREEMRARGISYEIVKKVMMESENRVRKRKSANTRMKLLAMDNEEMCDNKFPIEEDDVADLCEFLMRENIGIGKKFIRSLAEENDVWSLLELMMKESLKPVKITAWAENLKNFNWYYPDAEVRAVCEKLPQGIVQVKGDYFVMGEVLAKYNRVFKKVYTIELQTFIVAHDGVYEKSISQYFGVDSLVSSLSMGRDASPFEVVKRNDEVFISGRI